MRENCVKTADQNAVKSGKIQETEFKLIRRNEPDRKGNGFVEKAIMEGKHQILSLTHVWCSKKLVNGENCVKGRCQFGQMQKILRRSRIRCP